MKNTYKIIIVNTLLMGSLTAYAGGMSFENFDADKNGSVSEQEFNDARNAMISQKAKEGRQMRGLANIKSFADLDTNQDGQLTADEMAAMQKGRGSGKGKGKGRSTESTFTGFDAR